MIWNGCAFLACIAMAVLSPAQMPSWKLRTQSFLDAAAPTSCFSVHSIEAHDGGAFALTYNDGPQLTRFSSTGALMWTRNFAAPHHTTNLNKTSQDQMYCVREGSNCVYLSGGANRGTPYGDEPFLAKYDLAGQFLWVKYYTMDPTLTLTRTRIQVDSFDNVFLAATLYPYNSLSPKTFLAKYDANGNQLWGIKPLAASMPVSDIVDLQIDASNNPIILANSTSPYLAKFDPNGNLLWLKSQSVSGVVYHGSQFKVASDGSITAPFTYESISGNGTLLKHFSSSGSLIWAVNLSGFKESLVAAGNQGEGYCFANRSDGIQGSGYRMFKVSAQGAVAYSKLLPSPVLTASVAPGGNLVVLEGAPSGYGDSVLGWDHLLVDFDPSGAQIWSHLLSEWFGSSADGAMADFGPDAVLCFCNPTSYLTASSAKISFAGALLWNGADVTTTKTKTLGANAFLTATGSTYCTSNYPAQIFPSPEPSQVGWLSSIDAAGNQTVGKPDYLLTNSSVLVPSQIIPLTNGAFALNNPVRKYDAAGNLLWQSAVTGLSCIASDGSGGVFAVQPWPKGDPTNSLLASRINPDGTTAWQLPIPMPEALYQDPFRFRSGCDPAGNFIIACDRGSIIGPIKISPSGSLVWNRTVSKVSGGDAYKDIDFDASGNIYLTSDRYVFGTTDGYIDKYSPSGTLLWETVFTTGLNCPVTQSVLDGMGHLYTSGETNVHGVEQMIVMKLDASSGAILWQTNPIPNVVSEGMDVQVDDQHFPIVVGWEWNESDSFDDVILGLSPAGELERMSSYDAGNRLPDTPIGSGLDSLGNFYVHGLSLGTLGVYELGVAKFDPVPLDDAWIPNQTTPALMSPGQSYAFSVGATNVGKNTWTSAGGYRLDCLQPGTWGVTSLPLSGSDSIARGDTKTFNIAVVAPTTPGTYQLQFQMERSGVRFGLPSRLISVVDKILVPDDAQYVSQTNVPTSIVAGGSFTSKIVLRNVGTNTWSTSVYQLRSRNPYLNTIWGTNNLPLAGTVVPGDTATFSASFTAPATPGVYGFQWSMFDIQKGALFGDLTPNVQVTVNPTALAAQFISQTGVSASMGPAYSFSATITMVNRGSNTWDSTYALCSKNPDLNVVWGSSAVPVSGTVGTGASAVFTHAFSAPATPGTYHFSWRMLKGATFFGDQTPDIAVIVSADAAQFIGDSAPNSINAGTDFYIQNTMKNTGSTTWSSAGGYYMMSLNPTNNLIWGRNRNYLSGTGSFAPGVQTAIYGLCTAPIAPGTYVMQWQMAKSGIAFGEPTPVRTIKVLQGPDDAQFAAQQGIPTSLPHSTSFGCYFVFKNLGTATWDSSYSLVPVSTSSFAGSSMVAPTTAAGLYGTFTPTFTAPSTPGTYHFQFRIAHNGVKFGQATTDVLITVT